jgi:multidrug efflux pump subunit AcrA (membrane-fusion protein)
MQRFLKLKKIFNTKKRLAALVLAILLIILGVWKIVNNNSVKSQYQTAQVEKGTLINSISASGNISTVGNINILTQATGTIKTVYVKSGDIVFQGQKIAEITLDQNSQQKSSSAYASYLSAKNSLSSAQSSQYSLDSQMWASNQKFINDAVARGLVTNDPTYIQEHDDWLAAQAKYLSQQNSITQSQVSLNNAWLSYQQLAPIITAPTSGTISNLNVAVGLVIASSTTSSTTSTTSTSLGTITTKNIYPQALVNLSEIDVPNVKSGQKVTLTLDAFSGKTFTGKVLVINSNGQVSSGVTTYPATIVFDTTADNIFPNMGVNAEIITNVKTDVLLIPSVAVKTNNNQNSVQILKNGNPVSVNVEIGSSNDTQTEIVSGLSEGDVVITNTISSVSTGSGNSGRTTTSPFGGIGGGGGVRFSGGGR